MTRGRGPVPWAIRVAILAAATTPLTGALEPARASERASSAESRPAWDHPCRIDFQGLTFREALTELAARLGLPLVIDATTPADRLELRVRLYAAHLTGRQALHWLARWSDLDAAVVRGTAYIGPAERMPVAWRLGPRATDPGRTSAPNDPAPDHAAPDDEIPGRRKSDIAWRDVPLSFVARDVASKYGIDIIFHRDLVARQELIHLKQEDLSLEALAQMLGKLLGAKYVPAWGALGFYPVDERGWDNEPDEMTRPGAVATQTQSAWPLTRAGWGSAVRIDAWRTLRDRLASATGDRWRIEIPTTAPSPGLRFRGPVEDLLSAGKLLGFLATSIRTADSGQKNKVFVVRVLPSDR